MNPITRRDLLAHVTSIGALATAAPADPPAPRLKIVVTGGHPGDPEYGCGGTVAKYADLGHDVVLLYLNEGVPADRPKSDTRVREVGKACAILKARPAFAGQIDGGAIVDRAHEEAFVAILEGERPDIVFTHWPIDNHADHRAMSLLVYGAWRHMHKSFALYYYEVSSGEDTVQFQPTQYVDITAVEPRKRQACFAHASQSPEKFYALQDQVARMRGIERGCRLAEGFIHHVQSPAGALPTG
jgi:LmbE family N-acetylglucosaminyl deacetylase